MIKMVMDEQRAMSDFPVAAISNIESIEFTLEMDVCLFSYSLLLFQSI